MKEVYKYLFDTINDQDTIVVAVSGGIDSMVLLHLFIDLRKEKNITLICAHVNHKKRQESDEEAEFLERFCNENGIIFEMTAFDTYGNNNFQEEARKRRYEFFQTIVEKYDANYLATAHHGDDLMETILMRLTRGSTLKGYSGFEREAKNENYTLIRPLITVEKEKLIEYGREMGISFRNDVSNDSDAYTRNRFRKHVIPFLKQENRHVLDKLIKFSEMLREVEHYIEDQVDTIWNEVYQNKAITISKLLEQDIVVQKSMIQRLLKINYGNDITSITAHHMDEIFKVIHSKKPNIHCTLPRNKILKKSYDNLIIGTEKNREDYCFELKNSITVDDMMIELVKEESSKGNDVFRLNSKEIELPLWVRNRRVGDKMEVKGLHGSKKISDLFTDSKIDSDKRKGYPVITDNKGTILFVPKIKKSKYDKSLTESYDIIIKCI